MQPAGRQRSLFVKRDGTSEWANFSSSGVRISRNVQLAGGLRPAVGFASRSRGADELQEVAGGDRPDHQETLHLVAAVPAEGSPKGYAERWAIIQPEFPPSAMDAEVLFRANLRLIDDVIGRVCRRARLQDADAEDFASSVRVALIEDDYAILRKWEGRSSLAGYLTIVVRRLLHRHRDHELGRWYSSTEAVRSGPAALQLEILLHRDGRTLDEAVAIVRGRHPELAEKELRAIAERFPPRSARPRAVPIESVELFVSAERADERIEQQEAHRLAGLASRVVRETLGSWRDEDVMILRFRYGSSMSVADIARRLRLPQRPLYRRIEMLLESLSGALQAAGLDARVLGSLIGEASQEMNFGLSEWKNSAARVSSVQSGETVAEESS